MAAQSYRRVHHGRTPILSAKLPLVLQRGRAGLSQRRAVSDAVGGRVEMPWVHVERACRASRPKPAGREVGRRYVHHRPEDTVLYDVVGRHQDVFFAHLEEQGRQVPRFVHDEFGAYFLCGRAEHGFVRVKCEGCRGAVSILGASLSDSTATVILYRPEVLSA
jgi:hypothetical protein